MGLKKLLDKVKISNKTFMYYMIIVVLCGVLLILVGNVASSLNTAENSKETKKNAIQVSTNAGVAGVQNSYEDKVRKDLVDILSKIQGVGKVDVVVNYEEDFEEVPAKNINNTQEKIEEKDSQGGNRVTTRTNNNETIVTVNGSGGNQVVVVRKISPKVAGVIVVAEGAENTNLRKELLQAVKTVLAVPEHKVSIHSMKKN